LVLTSVEHEQLTRWVRRASSAQALAMRSRIVLTCAEGLDNKMVAAQVGCEEHTVSKWRRRFVEQRLDGLGDDPRPGRPRTISVDQVEDVIVATLESTPPNATHWTRSKMAERTGLSKTTIGKIWHDFGLKPHLVDHFKLSTDPLFIDKLYDVVGLYLNPPEAAVVLCVDENPGPSVAALPAGIPDDARHARAPHP
jgi:transposase